MTNGNKNDPPAGSGQGLENQPTLVERLKEKGFDGATVEEQTEKLLASQTESQRKLTDSFGEIKNLKERVDELEVSPVASPQYGAPQTRAYTPPQPGQGYMTDEYRQELVEKFGETAVRQMEMNQVLVSDALEEERLKDTANFNDRYKYANEICMRNPALGNTRAGIKKAFEDGDKIWVKAQEKELGTSIKKLFGPDVTVEILRQKIFGDPSGGGKVEITDPSTEIQKANASMQPAKQTTVTETGPNFDALIEDARKRGSADDVIGLQTKKAIYLQGKKEGKI